MSPPKPFSLPFPGKIAAASPGIFILGPFAKASTCMDCMLAALPVALPSALAASGGAPAPLPSLLASVFPGMALANTSGAPGILGNKSPAPSGRPFPPGSVTPSGPVPFDAPLAKLALAKPSTPAASGTPDPLPNSPLPFIPADMSTKLEDLLTTASPARGKPFPLAKGLGMAFVNGAASGPGALPSTSEALLAVAANGTGVVMPMPGGTMPGAGELVGGCPKGTCAPHRPPGAAPTGGGGGCPMPVGAPGGGGPSGGGGIAMAMPGGGATPGGGGAVMPGSAAVMPGSVGAMPMGMPGIIPMPIAVGAVLARRAVRPGAPTALGTTG
mmetsp:Transcript_5406/g.14907  ORF Transcript_5406/g.14907 Transcript_5406/m.14907 type:complete len:328 (-) Transcript_5406:790-1773(-)